MYSNNFSSTCVYVKYVLLRWTIYQMNDSWKPIRISVAMGGMSEDTTMI